MMLKTRQGHSRCLQRKLLHNAGECRIKENTDNICKYDAGKEVIGMTNGLLILVLALFLYMYKEPKKDEAIKNS